MRNIKMASVVTEEIPRTVLEDERRENGDKVIKDLVHCGKRGMCVWKERMGELGLWMALCQLVGDSQGAGLEARSWEATMLVWVRDDDGVDRRKGYRVMTSGRDWFLVHCEC